MGNALDLTMTLWLLVRLLVASLIGSAIGFERKYRAKGAGVGTHVLVAIGAALLSVPVKTYTEELLPKLMALRGVRIEKVD